MTNKIRKLAVELIGRVGFCFLGIAFPIATKKMGLWRTCSILTGLSWTTLISTNLRATRTFLAALRKTTSQKTIAIQILCAIIKPVIIRILIEVIGNTIPITIDGSLHFIRDSIIVAVGVCKIRDAVSVRILIARLDIVGNCVLVLVMPRLACPIRN